MPVSFDLPLLPSALPTSRWWTVLRPDTSAATRIWCFPCIGSGAAIWGSWVPHFANCAELVSISLPGREARLDEAPFTRLDELAAVLAVEMAPYTDERDVFCGHGFGGLLAYEVARRLAATDAVPPRGLVVCGANAPHHRWPGPSLHRLSPRDFLLAVDRYYGPIPAEFLDHQEFLELLLPALRADLEALETYRNAGTAALDIPILALAGRHDALIPVAAMVGWREHTLRRFEISEVSGGHFFVTENAGAVAARIREFLARFETFVR